MVTSLDALWGTLPLTTPGTVVERSEQTSRLINLMRADHETWEGLSDGQRRATVARLLFAAHRLNPDRCLHRRVVREGPEMRGATEGDAVAVLAILLMLCHAVVQWVCRGQR